MPSKTNRTVVRNVAHGGGSFTVTERHNERKNDAYFNGDIEPDRANLNVHYKRHLSPDGTPETYEQTFNRLLENGTIVKRGLRADAKIFDELIFDVNTAYFENHGGYEYAKSFFEEAYRCAVKEVGGEQYILSAIMHADELNKALSEQLGRDVYHYHLHVVYVPVVEKEILWTKRCKDPALVGKVKEVIPQISHSKKWPMRVPVERDGKTIMLNSYSLLQDRFFEHMREAGFEGFERGERGSTAEHLNVLDYKIKMDTARAEDAAAVADEKEKAVTVLDKRIDVRKSHLVKLDGKIKDRNSAVAIMDEIKTFGKKKNLMGQIVVTQDDVDYVKSFAREGVTSRVTIADLHDKIKRVEAERDTWKSKYERLMDRVGLFLDAVKRAPRRVMEFLADIIRRPPEKAEPNHAPNIQKSRAKQEER